MAIMLFIPISPPPPPPRHRLGSWYSLLVPLLVISTLSFFSFSDAAAAACNPLDQPSLLSFSESFPQLINWSTDSQSQQVTCCSWFGIFCDVNSRVTVLSLPSLGLHGHVSPSLLNLSNLSHLDLSHNFLSGPLPDRLFLHLNRLQVIDLSYNHLSGSLPHNHSLPLSIRSLDLSSNHFYGRIQPSLFRVNLVAFNISNNAFTGPIPTYICTNSPSLSVLDIVLDISFNDFSGELPLGFGACSNLQALRAGINNLTGQLPPDIYSAVALQEIFLPRNRLTGSIGHGITNLTNLKILALFGNELTGSIPMDIGKLSNLEQLLLHINLLSGTLPSSLTNCTKLKALNLGMNLLVGALSEFDFSSFIRLESIGLSHNNFSGILPPSLFKCKSLIAIQLATNNLEGQILPEISQLQSLSFLSIFNNTLTNITGELMNLKDLKNLSAIILAKNFFNESMPDAGIKGFPNLRLLALGGCNLTGQVPLWLSALGELEVLDLSFNQFTGLIPGWVRNSSNLFYIDLTQNLLSGGFPYELTSLSRLAMQQGDDQIKQGNFENPIFIHRDNASGLQYNQLGNLPPAIYLRSNISGNIPTEIGLLAFIHVLDLSNNNFSGRIPESISNLTNLEKLDLSGNKLTGVIPSSIKNLHFLSSFSVANNQLEGPIPQG